MVCWLRQELWNVVQKWKMTTTGMSTVSAEVTSSGDDLRKMRLIGVETIQQHLLDMCGVGSHSGHHSIVGESSVISFMRPQELIVMLGKGKDKIAVGWMILLHIFLNWNQCLKALLGIIVG
jgi:hypothetical protein